MKNFIVYNKQGNILRTGTCQDSTFQLQAHNGEFIMEGVADSATQKVMFDGFDEKGQPINPRVVDKSPEEIEADNPIPVRIPEGKQPAYITKDQWNDVLKKLEALENE